MRLSFLHSTSVCLLAAAVLVLSGQRLDAAEIFGLTPGPVELQSVGPMTFGPSGVVFVGDPKAAKVYAINTEDKKESSAGQTEIADLAGHVSKAFGGGKASVIDLAVNPETGNAFMTVTVNGKPGLAKVSGNTVRRVNLDKVGHAVATLPNPPEDKEVRSRRGSRNARNESITDVAFTEGRLLVSGLSTADSPSTVLQFDFPFREQSRGMQVEIYHAAHGRSEDNRAIQTFVPFNVGGEPSVLAGYTCTPLVKIPIGKIASNSKVTGTTVAELGNRNRPLDMIAYKQGGKDFLLIANSARGVMKVSTEKLAENEGLTEPVRGGGTAGQTYETINDLQGVIQLAQLDDTRAMVVIEKENQPLLLQTIDLP